MTKPAHRLKSLWFGVLVLIFLAWGWHRSTLYYEAVSYGEASGGRGLSLSQRNSLLIVTWVPAKAASGFTPGFHKFAIMMKGANKTAFPALFSEDYVAKQLPPSFRTILLPYWLVVLLFLIGWTSFLILRAQRVKRLTTDAP